MCNVCCHIKTNDNTFLYCFLQDLVNISSMQCSQMMKKHFILLNISVNKKCKKVYGCHPSENKMLHYFSEYMIIFFWLEKYPNMCKCTFCLVFSVKVFLEYNLHKLIEVMLCPVKVTNCTAPSLKVHQGFQIFFLKLSYIDKKNQYLIANTFPNQCVLFVCGLCACLLHTKEIVKSQFLSMIWFDWRGDIIKIHYLAFMFVEVIVKT